MEPEGQVAGWIEALRSYEFEVQHQAGRLHSNADAPVAVTTANIACNMWSEMDRHRRWPPCELEEERQM